jgi:hypothetical protein
MVLYILIFTLLAGRRTEDSEPNGSKRSPIYSTVNLIVHLIFLF